VYNRDISVINAHTHTCALAVGAAAAGNGELEGAAISLQDDQCFYVFLGDPTAVARVRAGEKGWCSTHCDASVPTVLTKCALSRLLRSGCCTDQTAKLLFMMWPPAHVLLLHNFLCAVMLCM
jgi:hypothetical protein